MKKKLLIISVILIIGIVSIVVFLPKALPQKTTLVPLKISLNWLHQAQYAGMYVAKEKGFYQELGLDPTFIEYDSATSPIDMLKNGQSDFISIHASDLFRFIDDGIAIKAIAAINETSPYALISLEESNIKTPTSFTGKNLGIKGGTDEGLYLYNILLKEFNINPNTVKFVSTSFDTTIVEDLMSKKVDLIDMYRTDQLYLFDQQGIKYNLIKPELFGYQSYGDIIVTTNKYIEDNPKIVADFVQATITGWQYALDHQDEAVDLTLKYVTNKYYQDKNYESFILSQSEPLIRSSKMAKIGDMNYLIWRRQKDFFFKNGIIKNNIDVSQIYTTEFIK